MSFDQFSMTGSYSSDSGDSYLLMYSSIHNYFLHSLLLDLYTIGTYFGTYASGDTLCMCVMHNMMHSLYYSIQTLFFFTGWAVLHEIKYLMFVSINLVIVVLKSTLNEKRYSVWKVFFLNYYFRIAKLKYLVIREQFYGELPSKPKE